MTSRRRDIANRRRNKRDNQTPSVPQSGALEFLQVGILRRPHGVKGEMLMAVMTDFPERIKVGVTLFLGYDHQPYEVSNTRHHNKGFIISFAVVKSRNDVDAWRNVPVFVRADDRPELAEGEYYQHELLGLNVVTDEGQALGVLANFIETGANTVYVVQTPDDKEILLPSIAEVVLKVDLEKSEITVHLLDGLLESNM